MSLDATTSCVEDPKDVKNDGMFQLIDRERYGGGIRKAL